MFVASAVLTQPLFMGGVITASNKIADITERMAGTQIEEKESNITYEVDNAYWLVVSLRHKQMLATDYLALVQKLDDDVHKMIREGVATRADGLRVDVALNEAEMSKTKVDNALTLARMYLCQKCGMDVNSDITLVDEQKEDVDVAVVNEENDEQVYERRRELKLLNDAIEISRQKTKIARAAYLPQLALMGGAIFTNPSVYNGFERKFKGSFNVGVAVRVPVLDWGENMYKIRAAKCATNLAQLTYDEAHDMIELQVAQSNFKVREANKKLITAKKNIQSAEENLRCANIGFKEGVMNTTDVMSAQTAWLKARTQKIDAEIDVKLSEIAQQKALGRN
jgi:outer membrane protein TolC